MENALKIDPFPAILPTPKKDQVQLPDGRCIDRTRVAFSLRPDSRNPSIFYATDRAYKRAPDGSLHRVHKKLTKKERKREKKHRAK